MIDYFAFCGVPPFGTPSSFPPASLLAEMDRFGIERAYVTEIESLYRREALDGAEAFIETCRKTSNRLCPVPVFDLSTWTFAADLRRLRRSPGIEAVRIAPNFHGYTLTAKLCRELTAVTNDLELMLLMAREIEDVRFQPACLGTQALSPAEIEPLLNCSFRRPLVLNGFTPNQMADIAPRDRVFFDISVFDSGFAGLERIVATRGTDELVFGSATPWLYPGAVLENLRKSLLDATDVRKIEKGGGAA